MTPTAVIAFVGISLAFHAENVLGFGVNRLDPSVGRPIESARQQVGAYSCVRFRVCGYVFVCLLPLQQTDGVSCLASDLVVCIGLSSSSIPLSPFRCLLHTRTHTRLSLLFPEHVLSQVGKASLSALLVGALSVSPVLAATDSGASSGANAKITTGGASTLQSGRTIAITRGVNLDNSDFAGQNLRGVAFQQSIVRNADFKGSNLVGASFFDATLDGTNFEDAGT